MRHAARARSLVAIVLGIAPLASAAAGQDGEKVVFLLAPELADIHAVSSGPDPESTFVVVDPSGTVERFMADEVVLRAEEPGTVESFAKRYGAEVMVGPELPSPPPEIPAERVREVQPLPVYRMAVDPRAIWLPPVAELAAEAGVAGKFEVSSEAGLALLGLLFEARRDGFEVSPNLIATPQLSLEHPQAVGSGHLDADDPCPVDAPAPNPWCFEHGGAGEQLHDRGAGRRFVEMVAPSFSPLVAIVDQGFAVDPQGRPAFGLVDLPAHSSMYDFTPPGDRDAGGTGCPRTEAVREPTPLERLVCWHGTAVALVATAAAGNLYGSVGTGASVARTMLFKPAAGDLHSWGLAIETAIHWGADVINVSLGTECGFFCDWGGCDDRLEDAAHLALLRQVAIVASAGNGGADGVGDDLDEDRWMLCGLDHSVICVGALVPDTAGALPSSNFGSRVHLWAPGRVLVAPLPVRQGGAWVANTGVGENALDAFGGTSGAAPYVAGTIALMQSIDPGIDLRQIKDSLRRTAARDLSRDPELTSWPFNIAPPDAKVRRSWGAVEVFGAVYDVAKERPAARVVSPASGETYWDPEGVPLRIELCDACAADSVSYYARYDAGDGDGITDHEIAFRGFNDGVLNDDPRFFDAVWDVTGVSPQSGVDVWAVLYGDNKVVQRPSGPTVYGLPRETARRTIRVRVDDEPPSGVIVEPEMSSRHRDVLPLRAEVEDDHGVAEVVFAVIPESGATIEASADGSTGFATSLDISTLPEQRLLVSARAYDTQANYTILDTVLAWVDRSGPEVEVEYPSADPATPTWITSTGMTQVRASTADPAGIAEVRFEAWYRDAAGIYGPHALGADATPDAQGDYSLLWDVAAIPDQVVRGYRTQAGQAPLVVATAFDALGNAASATGFVLGFDRLAPVVEITQPAAGGASSGGQLAIAAAASDLTSGVVALEVQAIYRPSAGSAPQTLSLGTTAGAGWTGTLDLDPLPDQVVQIVAEATDEAGNVGSRQRDVTLDRTPPTLAACNVADDPFHAGGGRATSISYQLGDPAASVVLTVRDGSGAAVWESVTTNVDTWPRVIPWDGVGRNGSLVSSGRYDVELTAVDGYGNAATYPCDSFAIVVDTTPPALTLKVPPTFALSGGPLGVVFVVDEAAYVELEIFDAGGTMVLFLGARNMAAGTDSIDWYGNGFGGTTVPTPASYTIQMRATDLAGNSATTSATVAVTR